MFKLEDSVTCGESVDVLAGGGWSLAVTAEGTLYGTTKTMFVPGRRSLRACP
jgi:hypothetical protein